MATSSFSDFNRECRSSGIQISDSLLSDPYFYIGRAAKSRPNAWYGAIAAAGNILRLDPSTELVDQTIPEELIEQPTIAQSTLIGILNSSRKRVTGEDPGTTFECEAGAPGHYFCIATESHFARTFETIDDPEAVAIDPSSAPGWTIVTSNAEVVGVQEKIGPQHRIGPHRLLAMTDYVVNGIPYPKGSIYRIGLPKRAQPQIGNARLAIPSGMIRPIAFLRLSAFAIPPSDRKREFPAIAGLEPRNVLRKWSLTQLQYAAQQAIEHSKLIE
jgi:hypothetical protein